MVGSNGTHEQILEFMQQHTAGVLATTDPDTNPHGAVIYFSINPNLCARFLTKRDTKKSDNLQHNNRAMLVVFDESSQTTVQLRGVATEIVDPDEAHDVFRNTLRTSLRSAENAVPPISKLSAGDYIAYELCPVEARIAIYDRNSVGDRNEMIKVLEFPAN